VSGLIQVFFYTAVVQLQPEARRNGSTPQHWQIFCTNIHLIFYTFWFVCYSRFGLL